MLRLLEMVFSQKSYCNGSNYLQLANFILKSVPRTHDMKYKQHFFSLFPPVTVDTGVRSANGLFSLLPSHGSWSLMVGSEAGSRGQDEQSALPP